MLGAGAMTNAVPEIRNAELLFVIGSNTTEAHPVIAMEMKRAVGRGARLIVADPRKIWLTEIAECHLQLRPGTDVALLTAMAHVIFAEDLVDHAFVDEHTENVEALEEAVRDCTPEWAETVTGVSASDIRDVARAYATTERAGIYYTLGITEHTHGTDNVYSLANLVLLTGHLGKPSAGLNPLRGQNNVQGANDAGASPLYYPGYQRVDDPEAREKWARVWGVPLSDRPGLNLNEMMKALRTGQVRGLYVMGEDILVSEPNASALEEALNRAELIVVQDILPTETMRFADVVLPAACFAEKDGVFTNTDRRVQRVRKAVDAPGEARSDAWILCEVARAAGYPMPNYESVAEIYAEMAENSPLFAGIRHERIGGAGLQWPCPSSEHPGTPTLHVEGPRKGRATFMPVAYQPSAESVDDAYPLVLSTGRTLYHYNAGTQTRRASGATAKQPGNFVEMHRYDARVRGLADGDRVEVASRRGVVQATVVVSPRMRVGCVWMPMHFPDQLTNRLTTDVGDTVTGTAEYKVCAVQVGRPGR